MTNDHSCRDSKLQFRGLYAYYPDTDEVFKIYGTGPRQVCIKVLYCPEKNMFMLFDLKTLLSQVTDAMIERYYKYNSGGKKFTQVQLVVDTRDVY